MNPQRLETVDVLVQAYRATVCRTKVCKEKINQTRNITDFCQFWGRKDNKA